MKILKNSFHYKREEGQNPYIGFMSFQHFDSETLYSDSVVDKNGALTETEAFECYPIPDDVPQDGRSQGFYPETSIAYIRVLWKEFEPECGSFNYAFIESLIEKARAGGRTLIFRLMPHSTRACDDVPDWLKKMIPCPERPEGKRVKESPKAPEFLEYFCRAIKMLGKRFDENPFFDSIDISLTGAWGEGYQLEEYPPEAVSRLIDTYVSVFKHTQLLSQLTATDRLIELNKRVNVGWRGDGLGSPAHIDRLYPPCIEQVSDLWKTVPVSFESYWWLGEWKRQGWDIDRIIETTLGWHISSINAKSLPIPHEWREKVEYWISKMGYHFMPVSVSFPDTLKRGESGTIEIEMKNCGVAPIYKRLPFVLRFVGSTAAFEVSTDTDITGWLPGTVNFSAHVTVPDDAEAGEYDIELGIIDPNGFTVYLCTDAVRDGKLYKVGKLTVM